MHADPAISDTDERGGMPSFSSAERILNCPGAFALSRGLSTAEKSWTRDGQLGHAVLAGEEDEDALTGHEDVEWAVERCKAVSNDLAAELGFDRPERVVKEERIWFHDAKGEPVASGKVDLALIQGGKALILDWKLGRKAVTAAPMNPQVIGYALLLEEEYAIKEAYSAIVQPWRKRSEQPTAHIDGDGLATWRAAFLEAFAAAQTPTAPRSAGPWCDYCPARAICPEARAVVTQALTVLGDQMPAPLALPDRYALLTATQKLSLYDWMKHAEKTLKELTELYKEDLKADPEGIPGLRIGKGSEQWKIPGSLEVYDALKTSLGLSEILSCASFSLNSLASVSAGGPVTVKKLSKPAEEKKQALKAALGPLAKVTQKQGSLERI